MSVVCRGTLQNFELKIPNDDTLSADFFCARATVSLSNWSSFA